MPFNLLNKDQFRNPGYRLIRALDKKRVLTLLFFFQLMTVTALSQTTITGGVTGPTGQPLQGVVVTAKAGSTSATTDSKGYFSITLQAGSKTLVFTHVGFKTQEIAIADSKVMDITLEEDIQSLQGVVVIGYGTQSRELVTTSISKLNNKVLENVPYSNVAAALQGTLPGVRVQGTSGQPGSAPNIYIRGGTSITNPLGASPLYIIDGVIRTNMNRVNAGNDFVNSAAASNANTLDINPDDIESIQVLKDAAATTIYGAQGSNGVVLITTKSGKSGKTKITYSFDLMNSEVRRTFDLASARDFIYFQRLGIVASSSKNPALLLTLAAPSGGGTGNDLTKLTAFTTQYLTPANQYKLNEGWESMPDPVDPTKTIIFKGTDFQKVLYRTGYSQNHSLTATGGTDKATFNASVGYQNSDGITINTFYKRLSLNLNGELKVRDNLKIFGRVLYSNVANNNDVSTNVFLQSAAPAPTTKYQFEDGTLAPGYIQTVGNPEYILNTRIIKNSTDNLTFILGFNWDILPGLTFNPQVSLYKVTADNRFFERGFFNGPQNFVSTRNTSGFYSKLVQQQADAVLNYNKSFKSVHNIAATAGFSYLGTLNASLNASGRGAASDLIPTLNASAQPVSVSGQETKQIIAGYFSRINYDFKQKYLLSVSARYDGASNLGNQHKWGLFPGISAGWNIDKEDFWKKIPGAFTNLKLRASYGVNGNLSGLGPYQAQGQYSVGNIYNGIAGVQNTVLANEDLQWEQSKTFDVGMDLGLFHSRINILFDYYRRVTDHLLTSLSLPQSTGFSSILTNLGTLQNKGIEIEIAARVLSPSSALQWDVSFNAAKVNNKILHLPYNGVENNRIGGFFVWDPKTQKYAWLGGLQEGGRIGDMYAYQQLGIYATDADAANGPVDMLVTGTNKTKYGGDVNWLDLDGNKVIDALDRVYVGNPYPVWTGGFSNSLTYKNFSLQVRVDFSTGNTLNNSGKARKLGQFGGEGGLSADVTRSWQKQGDITDIPRFWWADQQAQTNISRGNSYYYESGDYLAFREVTFSYSLSRRLLKKIKINDLRINLTGNNLGYLTRYTGSDPEVENGYPIPRNIILGVRVSL